MARFPRTRAENKKSLKCSSGGFPSNTASLTSGDLQLLVDLERELLSFVSEESLPTVRSLSSVKLF